MISICWNAKVLFGATFITPSLDSTKPPMCIGVSTLPRKHYTLSFSSSPQTCKLSKSPPILYRESSLYIGFSWTPLPPKNRIFQWIMLTFFILHPISSFKSKFLSLNSQLWQRKIFLFIFFFVFKYFRI